MKRIIVLSLVLLLAGCTTPEKSISQYTEEQINKDYGVKVKTKSVKESGVYGSSLFYFLSLVFGKSYDVTFEDTSDPKFTFKGEVDEDLTDLNEKFLSEKHQYLLKHNKNYQEKNEILLKNGYTDITIDGHSVKGKVYFEFNGVYNGSNVNTEELVNTLYDMASMIVRVPYKVSVLFSKEPKIESSDFNVQTRNYSKNERTELADVLKGQFEFVRHDRLVNEEMNSKLKELNLKADSNVIADYKTSNTDSSLLFNEHNITLFLHKEYNESNLLKAFEIFRDAGLEESRVRMYYSGGHTSYCKVKEIKNTSDFARCYKFYKDKTF